MNSSNSEHDFFISFSNKDTEVVSQIVSVLEKVYGAKCWLQTKDSRAEYVDEIMKGIETAKSFLVFVSPDSANSYYVLNEVNHAIGWWQDNPDYKILPVVIGPDDLDITDPVYKRIRFYLGRMNMLFFDKSSTIEDLALKILEQTEIPIKGETTRDSSYHVTAAEEKRLKAQYELHKKFSGEFYEKLVPENAIVLDVGCGNAEDILIKLAETKYRALLGVDKSEQQIRKAIENHACDKNKFLCCDFFSEDFDTLLEDYLEEHNAIGFDIINITCVLIHLAEPVKLLKNLRRYLKKNGYILINEPDDTAIMAYPHSEFFELAKSIWADSKDSGDRHCGRKIPDYLTQAGFSQVTLAKCGISNAGKERISGAALWNDFCDYNLWDTSDSAFYHAWETKKMLETYKLHYDEYKKEYDEGKIFLQIGSCFFYAQK